jgi:BASS family bile acid:Na+ symporter
VASVVVLFAVIAGAILSERDNVADYFLAVGLVALVFNVISLTAGYGLPRLAGVDRPDAIAAGMEIGIHNSALAIAIAVSPTLLNSTQIAIPAAVYGILMFFTAAAFGYLVSRLHRRAGGDVTEPANAQADRD